MRLLAVSATKTFPLVSTVTPEGLSNLAVVLYPSAKPGILFPAIVVTTPKDVTFRMRLLLWSATNTLPLASTVTPLGLLNLAFTPVPSANAWSPLPASVVTTPADVTFRIR